MHTFIFVIFALSTLVSIFYYLFFFRLTGTGFTSVSKETPSISVIICAHNELENLKKNLVQFLNQEYPNFEVILALDRCTDKSLAYVTSLKKEFSNLNVIDISLTPSGWNPKKHALVTASRTANYDYLVFTDADCWPKSKHWLTSYGSIFPTHDLIVGYSPHEKQNGFFHDFISYETMQTALTYLGFLKRGILYMCVGRNFGTRKDLYLNFSFNNVETVTGGDDDLYINSLSKKIRKTAIYSPNSQIITEAKKSFKDYLSQKKRHIHASKHYSHRNQIMVGIYNLSGLLFYLSFIVLLVSNISFMILFPFFLVRTSVLFYIFDISGSNLSSNINKLKIVYLDIIYFSYLWTWGVIALLSKRIKWI